ncbi:MAG: hypothetical protein P8Z73_06715 [Desulfobacteraceae bacterium]
MIRVHTVALLVVVPAVTLWAGNRRNRRTNLIPREQKKRREGLAP